eukprot:2356197-Amphidinium_carterae.1
MICICLPGWIILMHCGMRGSLCHSTGAAAHVDEGRRHELPKVDIGPVGVNAHDMLMLSK